MAAVASSLLKPVFEKLVSEALKEFGLLTGVDKQLRKLGSTLSTLQEVLEDAEARTLKDRALKGWLTKLKDVAYDADDVLDEFAAKAVKWSSEKEGWSNNSKVSKYIPKPSSIILRHKIAHRLKEIRERLDEIAEERTKFHLKGGVKDETIPREQTGYFVNESEVYGREQDREVIAEFLVDMSSGEDNLGVMAIVGLGGIGKTTVAQLVYNDDRVGQHFERRIWISVSDEFDTRRLSRSIIESSRGEEYNLSDIDSLQLSLRKELQGKRFFLVLDDVWNENYDKWDKMRSLLDCGAKGSKVLVTSRSERVASVMGTVPPHFLTSLSDADCWSLFEERAFGWGGAKKTLNLVAIGREIVRKCGGVPLAAKALGSLMRFKRGESEWLTIKDNEIWKLSDEENGILPALRLSYNHLPSRLKQCFAYCSIFPKDYNVRKEELVQLWIAEGFIRSSDRNTHLGDVGFQYVDDLLSRSLFQNGATDTDGVVRSVKMHDLVHDLAQSVAGEECAIVDPATGNDISMILRYSSLLWGEQIPAISESLNEAKKLRTFYLVYSSSMEEDQDRIKEFLHVILNNLKLLRALHLSNCPMKSLPESVTKLIHLRYLNLSDTRLQTLPPSIGKLHNLETLNLSYCQALRALPDSICDLHNLSTLDLQYCLNLRSLPNTIGQLTSLHKLNLSLCQYLEALPESVSCLTNLQELCLRCCYSLSELPENTKNMRRLVHLDTTSCYGLTSMPDGMAQLSRLRTLPIYVLGGKYKCSLRELSHLNLEGKLSIRNLECVTTAAEARAANLKDKQSLRSLQLEWQLNYNGQLRRASGDAATDDDDDDDDDDGGDVKVTLAHKMDALQMHDWDADADHVEVLEGLRPHRDLEALSIEGYVGRMLPSWMMELSVPNLVELSLSDCIRCENLPSLGQLPFLKILKLSELPNVRCLDSGFYGVGDAFYLLEELELTTMLSLEEWSGPSQGLIFPHLTNLTLFDCPKLESLPSSFPSVVKLNMFVDDDMLLSSLQEGSFPNLTHLVIGNCDSDDFMPEVLAERMDSVKSWSLESKPRPSRESNDSATMSASGIGFFTI